MSRRIQLTSDSSLPTWSHFEPLWVSQAFFESAETERGTAQPHRTQCVKCLTINPSPRATQSACCWQGPPIGTPFIRHCVTGYENTAKIWTDFRLTNTVISKISLVVYWNKGKNPATRTVLHCCKKPKGLCRLWYLRYFFQFYQLKFVFQFLRCRSNIFSKSVTT